MTYDVLHLKEQFPFLGENGADPTLTLYLPYNLREMKREKKKRPCMVILPGGAYAFCSERESEPIALHFLPEGYNVFILTYSVAPHRFPTQMREVAAALELTAPKFVKSSRTAKRSRRLCYLTLSSPPIGASPIREVC